MLDLKSKLLAAGLVTEEQVDKVKQEEEERRQRRKEARAKRAQEGGKKPARGATKSGGRKGRSSGGRDAAQSASPGADERRDAARWQRRLEQLQAAGKSEQYDAIRAWVQRARIDAVRAIPTDEAERFHFSRHDTGIASLVLEPDIKARIIGGDAAISAYMSHNGLAHCVVPREVAVDIAVVRPEWVRVLLGHDIVPSQDEQKAAAGGEPGPTAEGVENPGQEHNEDGVASSSGERIPSQETQPSETEHSPESAASSAVEATSVESAENGPPADPS